MHRALCINSTSFPGNYSPLPHLFVFHNEDYKNRLCNELQGEIGSVEILAKKINGVYIKESVSLESPAILDAVQARIESLCTNQDNPDYYARNSTDILMCKLHLTNNEELYLRVVRVNSGICFIEFHRGGFLSLITSVTNNAGLTELLLKESRK